MAEVTQHAKTHKLTVYLPDTRGTSISPFGKGNLKIGESVFTYSRLPGDPARWALGLPDELRAHDDPPMGTCPGATEECQKICYAARPVAENGPVFQMWLKNSLTEDVPFELPPGCTHLRLHISGDFTTRGYIDGWYALLVGRPDVKVWAYTRSWRVPNLLPSLNRLRKLPNVQLLASVDKSTKTEEITPIVDDGWRLAWIAGDKRLNTIYHTKVKYLKNPAVQTSDLGTRSLICLEERKVKPDCLSCRYCFEPHAGDVTFLGH